MVLIRSMHALRKHWVPALPPQSWDCLVKLLHVTVPSVVWQVSALANAAGVGGGAFFVPLFQVRPAKGT